MEIIELENVVYIETLLRKIFFFTVRESAFLC